MLFELVSSLEKCLFRSSDLFWLFFEHRAAWAVYILEINPWWVTLLANIFSRSVGSLFVALMVSFTVQKSLSLIRSHLFIFVFIFITLGGRSKKILLQFMSGSVLPMFSSKSFIRSDQISRSVVSDSLRPHELQHARPPCPSPTPGVHSDSCPSSQWCHPAISSSVVPFSSCPQSLPAPETFPMSQLFAWGGQSTGV